MLLSLDNLNKVEVYFEWKLIRTDPGDNKYVDAAVVGSADYIVTNDQHFNVLKSIDFPKAETISIDEFLHLILNK
jgi:predicted nucleic acid-binding protein